MSFITKHKKYLYLIITIMVMILIFCFSHQEASKSAHTSSLVGNTLTNMAFFKVLFRIFPIRKCAHFFIYLILGMCVIKTFNEFGILSIRNFVLTLLFCFLYACSDEFHQLFINGRSGNFIDVCIDTSGSLLGIFIFIGCKKLYKNICIWKNRKALTNCG
jgi:VanZ family protein